MFGNEQPERHTFEGAVGLSVDGYQAEPRILPTRQPMFESRDGVAPISFQHAMVAIVKQEDVAAGDTPETFDHFRSGLDLPVPGKRRPHSHACATAVPHGAADLGAAEAERRTHPARLQSGSCQDSLAAGFQFGCHPSGR